MTKGVINGTRVITKHSDVDVINYWSNPNYISRFILVSYAPINHVHTHPHCVKRYLCKKLNQATESFVKKMLVVDLEIIGNSS